MARRRSSGSPPSSADAAHRSAESIRAVVNARRTGCALWHGQQRNRCDRARDSGQVTGRISTCKSRRRLAASCAAISNTGCRPTLYITLPNFREQRVPFAPTLSGVPRHHPDRAARSASHTSGTDRCTVHAARVAAPLLAPPTRSARFMQPLGSVATRTNVSLRGASRSNAGSLLAAAPDGALC